MAFFRTADFQEILPQNAYHQEGTDFSSPETLGEDEQVDAWLNAAEEELPRKERLSNGGGVDTIMDVALAMSETKLQPPLVVF